MNVLKVCVVKVVSVLMYSFSVIVVLLLCEIFFEDLLVRVVGVASRSSYTLIVRGVSGYYVCVVLCVCGVGVCVFGFENKSI